MIIAVTGATGQLGRLVLAALQKKVDPTSLVGLARSPEKAADLGVPVRPADYNRPETLRAALDGVDCLVLISGSEVGERTRQHQNVVDAASAAKVSRVAYTSLLHADTSPIGLADEHRATETALRASGLPHTLLRNGWYTENYTAGLGAALSHGAVLGSAGAGRISAATRQDYAEALAAVALDDKHAGKTYELAGDSAFSLAELAAEVSKQTGREIPYRDLPVAEYAAILTQVGLPEPIATGIASWDACAAEGALFDESQQLSQLIGRPTTPLATAVRAALAAQA